LRETIFDHQKNAVKLEEIIVRRDEEIVQLTKKLKRHDALNQPIFSCTKCTKNFLSAALLDNHIQRKHPTVQESKDKDSNLINTIKLELEIKQLKERLNFTEKELMDVNRKEPLECEKCKRNAERSFQSIAIQSNFEEKEKDDVEKDAIYELLNNQMKHFEEWKHEEETRYRSEIFELRAKLDDTIEMLKQNASRKEIQTQVQAPSPAPRLLTIPEKPVASTKLEEGKSDDTLWKARYKELEKMYEENQQRMALTVTSIEATYSEKMSKIEESVKHLTEEREKIRNEIGKKTVEVIQKPEIPLTPRVVKTMHAQEISSESSSSESEYVVKVICSESQKASEMDKIEEFSEPEKPKTIMETFSAQKFSIRPKKQQQQLTTQELPKQLENSRDKAEKLLNQRLKSFGIQQSEERMKKLEFESVHDRMVTKREEVKGKHKSFFITRKNWKSKVEKIFNQKHKHNESNQKVKSKKDMKLSVDPERIPNKSLNEDHPTNMINETSSLPSRKFHEDLEKMLAKKLSPSTHGTLKKPFVQNDQVPSTSVKSKKVLFNMNHLKDSKKIDEINEDDSDFDISSFSNFTTEDEK
jgi:zinc finger protein DZIP1